LKDKCSLFVRLLIAISQPGQMQNRKQKADYSHVSHACINANVGCQGGNY
jgi:hypothetical protein